MNQFYKNIFIKSQFSLEPLHIFKRKPDGTLHYMEKYLLGNKEIDVTDAICEPTNCTWLLDRLELESIEYLGIGIKKDYWGHL